MKFLKQIVLIGLGFILFGNLHANGPRNVQSGQIATYIINSVQPDHIYSVVGIEGGEFLPTINNSSKTVQSGSVGKELHVKWGAVGTGKIFYTDQIHQGGGRFIPNPVRVLNVNIKAVQVPENPVGVNEAVNYTNVKQSTAHYFSHLSVSGGVFYPSNTTTLRNVSAGSQFKIKWSAPGQGKITYVDQIHVGRGSFNASRPRTQIELIGATKTVDAKEYGVFTYLNEKKQDNHSYSNISVIGGELYPFKTTSKSMGIGTYQIKWGKRGKGLIIAKHQMHTGGGVFVTGETEVIEVIINKSDLFITPPEAVVDHPSTINKGGMKGPGVVVSGQTAKYDISGNYTYYELKTQNGTFTGVNNGSTRITGNPPTTGLPVKWGAPGIGKLSISQRTHIGRGSFNHKNYAAEVLILGNDKTIELRMNNNQPLCSNQEYEITSNADAFSKYEWVIQSNDEIQKIETLKGSFKVKTGDLAQDVFVRVRGYDPVGARWSSWSNKTFFADQTTPARPVISGVGNVKRGLEYVFTAPSASSYEWGQSGLGSFVGSTTAKSAKIKVSNSFVSGNITLRTRGCNAWSAVTVKEIMGDISVPNVVYSTPGDISNLKPNTVYQFTIRGGAEFFEWKVSGDASIVSGQNERTVSVKTSGTGVFKTAIIYMRARNFGAWSEWKSKTIKVDARVPNVAIGRFLRSRDYCRNESYDVYETGESGAREFEWRISGNGRITSRNGRKATIRSNSSGSSDIIVQVRGRIYSGWSSWATATFTSCSTCRGNASATIENSNGENVVCTTCPMTHVLFKGDRAESYSWSISNGRFRDPELGTSCNNNTTATFLTTDNNTVLASGNTQVLTNFPNPNVIITGVAKYCDDKSVSVTKVFKMLDCNFNSSKKGELTEELAENAVSLWPNPVASGGIVTISGTDITEAVVFDLVGNKFSLPVFISESQVQVSTDGLPTGVYMVQLNKANGSKTMKFEVF